MIINQEHIHELIPQRPPFVMVDQLLYSDEKVTRTQFRVKEDNLFVKNSWFTEGGLIENIAQTAAAGAGYAAILENKPVRIGFIGSVKDLEVFALPKVNDILKTEIIIEHQVFDVTIISGCIRCNNAILVKCEMKIFIIPTQ